MIKLVSAMLLWAGSLLFAVAGIGDRRSMPNVILQSLSTFVIIFGILIDM